MQTFLWHPLTPKCTWLSRNKSKKTLRKYWENFFRNYTLFYMQGGGIFTEMTVYCLIFNLCGHITWQVHQHKKDIKRIDHVMFGCCSIFLLFSPHIFVRSAFLGSLWRIWNINISRPSPLSSSAASSASASASTWWWSLERSRAIADENLLAGLLPKGAVELASPPIEAIIRDRTPMKQPYY